MRPTAVMAVAAACCALIGVAACQSNMGATASSGPISVATPSNEVSDPALPTGPVIPTRGPTLSVIVPPARPTIPTPPPVTNPPPPTGARTPVPASRITTVGMATKPAAVQTTGNDVVFMAQQSGCQQLTAEATAQTPAQVTITVTTSITARGSQVCPMYERDFPLEVALSAPLANRTLKFVGITKHT